MMLSRAIRSARNRRVRQTRKASLYESNETKELRRIPLKMLQMIKAFRNRGHFAALLDPLSFNDSSESGSVKKTAAWLPENPDEHPDVVRMLRHYPKSIDLSVFGLDNVHPDATFDIGDDSQSRKTSSPEHSTTSDNNNSMWTVNDLTSALISTYCGNVGIEYIHISNRNQRKWLEKKIEGEYGPVKWLGTSTEEQKESHLDLVRCDHLAKFLNYKFRNAKVFGIEGCESLILGLQGALKASAELGVEGIEMGMAHRGRMNVLHTFFRKPLKSIVNMFSENEPSELGDVKYHLGTRAEVNVKVSDGTYRTVHISLAANPSHLEAVCPVVIGKTKAKQFFVNDTDKTKVIPIILHGDAAFSGQGIVPEVMELSDLPDYTVGGCVHIVINNQIGFTTDPRLARTSYHCTNVAKGVGAPIFHVNGDDVDAVVTVCKLAVAWRQQFKRDCVVDIVCYRRHGHNSQDDPSITQPQMYLKIRAHPSTLEVYERKLIDAGVLTQEECMAVSRRVLEEYEREYEAAKSYKADPLEWLASNWQGAAIGSLVAGRPYNQTGVPLETLHLVGRSLLRVPDDFEVHKDIQKLLQSRAKALETGKGVTMAFAEALAFGCLMSRFQPGGKQQATGLRGLSVADRTLSKALDSKSGSQLAVLDVEMLEHPTVHIRLSGQDCIRGTFNQRHAAITCQRTGRNFWQLNNMEVEEQAKISVCNSSLSEAAILGFEYGYSLSNEMALTIWEAQFGDFANVAQSIIDNFIASGEQKWNNQSSLVMLLPHGYDGQGPEHSSGRLERFLQLVDDDPDVIPGITEPVTNASTSDTGHSRAEILEGFDLMAKDGVVRKEEMIRALLRYAPTASTERIDLALAELLIDLDGDTVSIGATLSPSSDISGTMAENTDTAAASAAARKQQTRSVITKEKWCELMASWLQTNSERRHNLIVVMPSTPAQYFHLLRRQIHRPFAKPLVCMSPKWLLHHKACTSPLSDMCTGTYFHRVIVEGGRGDNMADIQATRSTAPSSSNSSSSSSSDIVGAGLLTTGSEFGADDTMPAAAAASPPTLASSIPETSTSTAVLSSSETAPTDKSWGTNEESAPSTNSPPSSSERLSSISNTGGTTWLLPPAEIRRIVFCSGKIFYHLFHARAAANIRDITLIRVEQIAPFPYDLVGPAIQRFPNAELVWVQEEPKNMGAWVYVKPRFDTTLRENGIHRAPIRYVGRKPAASAATGGYKVHIQEQKDLVDRALSSEGS